MKISLLALSMLLCCHVMTRAQNPVSFEAESGMLGSDFNSLTAGSINYITCLTDLVNSQNPGNSNRVVTYTITFPAAGTYELYGRVRVGLNGGNDDSYFYGNGFGVKAVASDADWITSNNLNTVGDTAANAIVSGGGFVTANNVWKWINFSQFNGGEAPVSFVVTAGSLTKTFQIGGRENGLDFDKFVFGLQGVYYTVTNLNNGEPGSTVPPPPPFTPVGPPLATGLSKFLGCAYSSPSQKINFGKYWNQVTPENAGKWGSVEATRDVMNWSELDSAYKIAKDSGYPFKLHTLIWGSQQPSWIETLTADEQLMEIKQWFSLVAQRYPAIDFIEVVNEPLHAPPNHTGSGGGNYINALGGSGATGWDWVLNSFRMARQYFPNAKLWINDYSIVNSTSSTNQYLQIVNLLKAENLIDGIGEQAHAFTTFGTSASTITTNLNTLAASGLPLYATELDIDGPPAETPQGDTAQLREYQRVFPLFWQHPAIKGVTLWGYRPGHWRTAQGAPLVYSNGAEKAAMIWLKQYINNTALPVRLMSFEAARNNARISITWTSVNEYNNDHYVVERSADGTIYVPLQVVKANKAGADTQKDYQVYDNDPRQGKNFYRLVQYDIDGQRTYYEIRLVNFSSDKSSLIEVYPNPASISFTIRTQANALNKGVVTITNVMGSFVKEFTLPASGIQTVTTNNLPNGIYFIHLNTNGASLIKKVVINR